MWTGSIETQCAKQFIDLPVGFLLAARVGRDLRAQQPLISTPGGDEPVNHLFF